MIYVTLVSSNLADIENNISYIVYIAKAEIKIIYGVHHVTDAPKKAPTCVPGIFYLHYAWEKK